MVLLLTGPKFTHFREKRAEYKKNTEHIIYIYFHMEEV